MFFENTILFLFYIRIANYRFGNNAHDYEKKPLRNCFDKNAYTFH